MCPIPPRPPVPASATSPTSRRPVSAHCRPDSRWTSNGKPPVSNKMAMSIPYVIRHWADRDLPVVDPGGGDPRDEIAGVYGLRYRITGSRVVLYWPGSQAQIRLHGFNPGWWERAATRRRREYAGSTLDTPHWTEHESRAHQLTQEAGWEPAGLLSPLLRRIRATAGGRALQRHQRLVQRGRSAARNNLWPRMRPADRAAVQGTDHTGLDRAAPDMLLPQRTRRGLQHQLHRARRATHPLHQPPLGRALHGEEPPAPTLRTQRPSPAHMTADRRASHGSTGQGWTIHDDDATRTLRSLE